MSDFYADLAATAEDLLQELGQAITLRKQAAGTYDPATGAAAVTPADTTGVGVALSFNDQRRTFGRVDGTAVQVGDRRVLWRGATAPAPGDQLLIGGVAWAVLAADQLNPAGTVLLYEIHVRQ